MSSATPIGPRDLEDASGFRGHAGRPIVPANDADLSAALREATASTVPPSPVRVAAGTVFYRSGYPFSIVDPRCWKSSAT